MSLFLVGYDLQEGENYDDLIDAIKNLADGYWHNLDSTWFVLADSTTHDIRDKLAPHLPRRDKDRLLVVKIQTPVHYALTQAFSDKAKEWLKNHLSA